jgi:hypothetical protein
MTPIQTVSFDSPITDPAGSSIPKRSFTSGAAYTVTKEGDEFTITSVCTGTKVKCNFRAEWREKAEAFPSKAELLTRIDDIEEKALGTRRGKKTA